jgi:hypothetical protein
MSARSVSDLSEMSKLILAVIEPWPRSKKNVFSSYKSRAKKNSMTEDEAIQWAARSTGIFDQVIATANSSDSSANSAPTALPAAAYETEQTLGLTDANSVGVRRQSESARQPANIPPTGKVLSFPALPTAPQVVPTSPSNSQEKPSIADPTSSANSAQQAKSRGLALKVIRHAATAWLKVHGVRYSVFKLIVYAALVPASSQAVHSFFKGLDLYGNSTLNFGFAILLTAAVDILAIDMLTRAATALRMGQRSWGNVGLLSATLLVITGNVLLTHQNMSNNASIGARVQVESDWKGEVAEKETQLSTAEEAFAEADGRYLSMKWPGNSDPAGCELGKVKGCRGPFTKDTRELQAKQIAAKTKLASAQAALTATKATKPVEVQGISQGVLELRIWLYAVLWGLIVLASVVAPIHGKGKESHGIS